MKNYQWILFDADETLFNFDAFSGLQLMFANFDIQFTDQHYHDYQLLNKSLWVEYQKGNITAQQLQQQRFTVWGDKLQKSPQDLNSAFLDAMAEICTPIAGAESLLHALKGKAKLGIITNGFTDLQQVRLERTGLKDHFDFIVISEQIGVAKPHPDIFDHALDLMGNPDRKNVLMVGDNLETDILGGLNAGLDTCWLNRENKLVLEHITPHYHVDSLAALERLLGS